MKIEGKAKLIQEVLERYESDGVELNEGHFMDLSL